ncbi:BspA family leucine-rich repeat surface protein [Bombilactobacillus thymidiniphilus]|uniref:BspA family leucine-rich repeat surface protein n=1 Tax=Bombilactobacillus thymidiniphilus TaxID=2923363 RepID=A0ABY4PER3_9LACO|nr:BspA family leucine-rich repeat surface protein [Bombilactobacillus thymidiniphilus]UQS84158.1 BspA family leucine-rich repeat surface protein [Bombilactobacillus thymidiniphilus]
MNSKKLSVRTMGTFLGLVCGIVLNHQAVHADTNEQENPRVATSLVETTESTANINNTELSNTNTQTTVTNNQESPNLTDTPTTYPATNDVVGVSNSNVADMNNDASNSDIVNDYSDSVASDNDGTSTVNDTNNVVVNNDESAATNTPLAQGTWGTSKWDYTQDGADYVLTFHAGTLGTGGINQSKEFHDVPNLKSNNYDDSYKQITEIVFDKDVVANVNSSKLFEGLTNLKEIIGLKNLDTANVTNMTNMFSGCESLISLDLSNFDTSNVTDMYEMFQGCKSLTSLDLSNFNTANVTDMEAMFYYCTSLTDLNLSTFDTANVTDMSWMFQGCTSLINLNLNSFNTSNVNRMAMMFESCNSLNSIDLSSFDISNVTNATSMFENCSSLTDLDLSNFDTANLYYSFRMFENCKNLKNIKFGSKFTLSKGGVIAEMFYGCSSLKNLDLSSFYTPVSPDFSYMFYDCTDLTNLDISHLTGEQNKVYIFFNTNNNLAHIVVGPDVRLEFSNIQNRVGQIMPGTNKKVISNDWVAISGYQKGKHYTSDELANLIGRDQITTYEWDIGQSLDDQEVKAVTRTINVHQPNGQVQTENQTAMIERTVHYNDDGTLTYGDWSKAQWDNYPVSAVAGYQASMDNVVAQGIDGDTQDQTVDIYYTPIEQTVTIQYLDPAGNEVGTQTLTGYAGEIYNLHYRVPNGYELIDQPQTTITIDASGKQVIQAYVEDQIAQSSESKTMLRVINVHYPSGATKHENQLAVLHRNLYVDQVTHETIYGTWSTGNFDEYHVPVVNGYTASQPLVQGVTVTSADHSVSTIDIYYSQNS